MGAAYDNFLIEARGVGTTKRQKSYKLCMFQAILFYIPRWLWKNWEAGKISALKMDLDQGIIT